MRGHAFPTLSIMLAGLALAGCASTQGENSASRMFGLRPGPLPPPQAFVVESRAAAPQGFPRIGDIPPPRPDRVLSVPERKALEDSLKRYQDRSVPSRTAKIRKKPAAPQT